MNTPEYIIVSLGMLGGGGLTKSVLDRVRVLNAKYENTKIYVVYYGSPRNPKQYIDESKYNENVCFINVNSIVDTKIGYFFKTTSINNVEFNQADKNGIEVEFNEKPIFFPDKKKYNIDEFFALVISLISQEHQSSIGVLFIEVPRTIDYRHFISNKNLKKIFTIHSNHFTFLQDLNYSGITTPFKSRGYKTPILDKNTVLVALTNYQANEIKKMIGDSSRVRVISHYAQNINRNIIPKNEREHKIVILSLLRDGKRVSDAIEAMSKITDKKIILEIYGDGPHKNNLIELSKKLGIEKRIKFMGYSNDSLESFSKAKFAIMLSDFEGFGLTILEGLSMGTPHVAYDVAYGPREMIKHGENGFLVPYLNKELLVESMNKMLEEDSISDSHLEISKKILSKFSLSGYTKEWINTIDHAISRKQILDEDLEELDNIKYDFESNKITIPEHLMQYKTWIRQYRLNEKSAKEIESISINECDFSYGYTMVTLIGDYIYERPLKGSNFISNYNTDVIFYSTREITRIYLKEFDGKIFGRSYYDNNATGLANKSKQGIRKQRVTLLKGGKIIRYGITDKSGNFLFCNLAPGNDYQIKINKGDDGILIETTNKSVIYVENKNELLTEKMKVESKSEIEINFGFRLSLKELKKYQMEKSDEQKEFPELIYAHLM